MASSEGPPQPPQAAPEPQAQRARRWWLAAGAFVVGLFAGGIIVGVVAGGSTPLPASGADDSTAAPGTAGVGTASKGPASGATAQVTVNEACLRALNAAQDVYGDIGDLADAARQLNAARLDQVIRDLEPLQARLRRNLEACNVVARLPGPGGGSPATTTASPTS